MLRDLKAAFTLIELLVVIAVIAVLAAILFPVFARVREKGRQASCLSNQRQIAAGWQMYIQDWDETFPFVLAVDGNSIPTANWGDGGKWPAVPGVTGVEPQFRLVTLVSPYVKDSRVWYCPSVGPDYMWQAVIDSGVWPKGARMRDQGTTYAYTQLVYPYITTRSAGGIDWSKALAQAILVGGKPLAILKEPSRWPMLFDEPSGCAFTGGNLADPPAKVVPHSGGLNLAYGDGHAAYHHIEKADKDCYMNAHAGDGIYPGQ